MYMPLPRDEPAHAARWSGVCFHAVRPSWRRRFWYRARPFAPDRGQSVRAHPSVCTAASALPLVTLPVTARLVALRLAAGDFVSSFPSGRLAGTPRLQAPTTFFFPSAALRAHAGPVLDQHPLVPLRLALRGTHVLPCKGECLLPSQEEGVCCNSAVNIQAGSVVRPPRGWVDGWEAHLFCPQEGKVRPGGG